MKNLLRAQAGKYIAEGSLAPSVVVLTGLVNNVFDGYTPPQATGGSVTYVNEHGIRYKNHSFSGSDSLVVSGSPRNSVIAGVRGGGGGGAFRWNYGEPGGYGGNGGLGVGVGEMKIGNRPLSGGGTKTITVGGGGAVADGTYGGTGGTSQALGITSYGGYGGGPTGGGGIPGPNGSPGSASVSDGRSLITGTWNILDDTGFGGSGGYGGSYIDGGGFYSTSGSAGSVQIRYRFSK
jgi:hypothetical protein